MLDRWINIFFSLALIFVFILVADASDHIQILSGLMLALGLSFLAFFINWLSYDGAVSATIFGTIAYGLGGMLGAAIVLMFFISASLLSKDLLSTEVEVDKKYRRNGIQVWANGFWFTLWVLAWFLFKAEIFLVAAVVSMAASNSDTWATEIGGNRVKGNTRLISNFEKVPPGTDGGISFMGTLGALAGAMAIAGVFWVLLPEVSAWTFIIISVSGFLGSLLDSYIGARFQNSYYNVKGLSFIGVDKVFIGNNFVNWSSAGAASIVSLVLILII